MHLSLLQGVVHRGIFCLSVNGRLQRSSSHSRSRKFAAHSVFVPDAACAEQSLQSTTFLTIAQVTPVSDAIYRVTQSLDALVEQELTGLSPASFAIVLAAGLLTSLSPCTLSVLPLTIGYIGGYKAGQADKSPLLLRASAFSAGLATTFAALGLVATGVGRAYGQIGDGLPIAVSIVAILMGLNLLEIVPLRLPSLDVDARVMAVPPLLQTYLVGATFALAASPCSTPILATLLAYVSTTEDPATGAALLFTYSLGYVAPLLLAAASTSALTQVLAVREWSAWIPPASGFLLVSGGTFTLLSRLV